MIPRNVKFSNNGFMICFCSSLVAHLVFFSSWNIKNYTDQSTEVPFISVKLNFAGNGGDGKAKKSEGGRGGMAAKNSTMPNKDIAKQIDKMVVKEMEGNVLTAAKKLEEIKTWKQTQENSPSSDNPVEAAANTTPASLQPGYNQAENLDYSGPAATEVPSIASYDGTRGVFVPEPKPEVVVKYEQALSLWLEKNKVVPPSVRAAGRKVEAVVRIRIDRKGNLQFNKLEKSSGDAVADAAITQMVQKSNPFPAVPVDYPRGDPIDFLIPVRFSLD